MIIITPPYLPSNPTVLHNHLGFDKGAYEQTGNYKHHNIFSVNNMHVDGLLLSLLNKCEGNEP